MIDINQEFSDSFDVLINSYADTVPFGDQASKSTLVLDEYEKSVCLTKAQEEIALAAYKGTAPFDSGFEQTEEMRRYLSTLVCEAVLHPIPTTSGNPLGMNSQSKFFSLPDGKGTEPEVWFITYESLVLDTPRCSDIGSVDVYPVRQDEYNKIKRNPFRGINDRRALRLDLSDNVVEIKSNYENFSYYIRYIKRLKPIILESLEGSNVSIEGEQTALPCELPESLHHKVLERAVMIALQSRGYIKNDNK